MASERTMRARLALLVEVRAILSIAALSDSSLHRKKGPPSYAGIAKTLAFHIRNERKAVSLCDEIYNEANGPDDWSPKREKAALTHCQLRIDILREDLGLEHA